MRQQFNWYPPKAAANWRSHGVTFEQGAKAIGDMFAVDWLDDREDYGKERSNLLGMCDGVLLHVTYTERNECIWIISARKADRHEQDTYFRKNSV
ncbi:MAG: BrnT family toxin [Magnetococcales bacterium]|nr:BrnT family toxin [Magnetococcales bacterium]